MDRNYIHEHLLVDRYLRGALSKIENDAFEERLVWDTDLVDELDLAERLREGLRESVARERDAPSTRAFDFFEIISGLLAVPQYAAAASFLLAAVLTAALLNPFAGTERLSSTPAMQTDIKQLFSVRGAAVLEFEVDANAWTVFSMDAMEACASYRVALHKVDDGAVAPRAQLELGPDADQVLAIGMPGKDLDAGNYVLSLEGIESADGRTCNHTEEIPFRITTDR